MRTLLISSWFIMALIACSVLLWIGNSYTVQSNQRKVESRLVLQKVKHQIQENTQCYNVIKKLEFTPEETLLLIRQHANGKLDSISHFTAAQGEHKVKLKRSAIGFQYPARVDLNLRVEFQPSKSYQENRVPITWVDSSYQAPIIDPNNQFFLGDSAFIDRVIHQAYTAKQITISGWKINDLSGQLICAAPMEQSKMHFQDSIPLYDDLIHHKTESYWLFIQLDATELLWKFLSHWETYIGLGLTGMALLLLIAIERSVQREKRLVAAQQAMLNNVSHEFNTQVSKIMLSVERLKETSAETTTPHMLLDIIERASKNLGQGIHSFLTSGHLNSKAYTVEQSMISIDHWLKTKVPEWKQEALDAHKQLTLKNSSLEKSHIQFNQIHLTQVLNNLIDNAIKYGGNAIEIELSSQQRILQIKVSDNGYGVPDEHLQHIFDPYFRVDVPKANGFGIGLSYCKAVMKANHGSIKAENKKGMGFSITLIFKTQ